MHNSDLFNYADDNTVSAWANPIKELIETLESESEIAIKWFHDNEMAVNPDKFQAIIINKHGCLEQNKHVLKFNEYKVTSSDSVNLLGIEIDDKLTFQSHIQTITRKAAGQLNYLIQKKHCLNQKAKQVLIESFIMSNFNYAH
jgi:TATA-binding protein-associated factor Taf7